MKLHWIFLLLGSSVFAQDITMRPISIVNSRLVEANAFVNPSRTQLYFMSTRGGQSWSRPRGEMYNGQWHFDGDLYISERINGKWTLPQNLGDSINTKRSEDEPMVSADGNRMVYESWAEGWQQRGGPYYRYDFQTGTKQSLHPAITSFFMETNFRATDGACISVYEDLFFFAAGPTLHGNMDIYFIRLNEPESQVQKAWMSTDGNERTPFLAADGHTFYFSSDSYGDNGLDILKTSWSENQPEKVKTLPAPLNTAQNDYNFTISAAGEWAYCIRNGDIYEIDFRNAAPWLKPEPCTITSLLITDCDTKKSLQADLSLFSENELKLQTTLAKGAVPSSNPKDRLLIHADGYDAVLLTQLTSDTVDVCLHRSSILTVQFAFDSYDISNPGFTRLIPMFVKDQTQVLLIGSADSKGTDDYNFKLSQKRIETVAKILPPDVDYIAFPWGEQYSSAEQNAADRKVVLKKLRIWGDIPSLSE